VTGELSVALRRAVWCSLNMAMCVLRSMSKVNKPFIFQGTSPKIVCYMLFSKCFGRSCIV
jgi:hypothetical protein